MIRLRNPKADDKSIHAIIVEELVPHSQNYIPKDELNLRATTERLNRSTTYVLVNKGSHICGFINFFAKDQQLVVDMIALDRNFQGLGWGGRLLRAAENYGRRMKCSECILALDQGNERAYQFYEKNGYNIVDYMAHIRCFRLAKKL